MSHLHGDQEEADTKQILNAIDATISGATTIQIHSPDCRTCPYIEPIPSTLRPYSLCYWSWSETQDNPTEANLHSSWERTSSGYIRILCNADSTGCFYGKGKPNFSWNSSSYTICAFWRHQKDSLSGSGLGSDTVILILLYCNHRDMDVSTSTSIRGNQTPYKVWLCQNKMLLKTIANAKKKSLADLHRSVQMLRTRWCLPEFRYC